YRSYLLKIQKSQTTKPIASITHYDLSIELNQNIPLKVGGNIHLKNVNKVAIDTLILSLNSGLKVSLLKINHQDLKWMQVGSVIKIKLEQALALGDSLVLQVAYQGNIDVEGFDLQRELGEPRLKKRDGPINKGSMTAWVEKNSVFLPARSRWYPVSGVDYGYENGRTESFSTTHLTLFFSKGLEVITQGSPTQTDTTDTKIKQEWISEKPIPQLSLNAGIYKKIEANIHDINCVLYVHPSHWKQVAFFEDAKEEVIEALGQIIDAMEQESGLFYPYPRLSVVEVPFQVQWYWEGWEETGGLTSPGVLMIEEDTLYRQRFRRDFSLQEERSRGNREPKQIKRDLFVRAVMSTFFNNSSGRGSSQSGVFRSPVVQLWSFNKSFSGDHYALVKQGMPLFLQQDLSSNLQSSLYAGRGGGRSRGGFQRPNINENSAAWDTLVA
ncbi:MAG: hypothetical protein ACO36I_23675, partial [Candidatus Latescibacterota bacterium]